MAFTFALAVPLWLTAVLATTRTPQTKLRHFVGTALPRPLAGLIAVIELVGVIIRPVTLRVRLAANMMAGHIILMLATTMLRGGGFVGLYLFKGGLVVGLYLFEVGIAFVQAYVFVLLVGLYMAE